MSLAAILPEVQALPHGDKIRLLQVLASELSKEEIERIVPPGGSWAIWSPYDAYEAAATLDRMLAQASPGLNEMACH